MQRNIVQQDAKNAICSSISLHLLGKYIWRAPYILGLPWVDFSLSTVYRPQLSITNTTLSTPVSNLLLKNLTSKPEFTQVLGHVRMRQHLLNLLSVGGS